MHKTRLTLTLLVLVLVAGCQYLPIWNKPDTRIHPITTKPARPETDRISELLSYYRSLGRLDEDGLKARLRQLRDSWKRNGCSTVRLKSAMILSQLAAHNDEIDPNAVLDPCLGEEYTQSSVKSKLALLLRDLIETRRVASGAQIKIKDYHRQLKALQDENHKLHKQLEGLKAIEKSIQQRNLH